MSIYHFCSETERKQRWCLEGKSLETEYPNSRRGLSQKSIAGYIGIFDLYFVSFLAYHNLRLLAGALVYVSVGLGSDVV